VSHRTADTGGSVNRKLPDPPRGWCSEECIKSPVGWMGWVACDVSEQRATPNVAAARS
jgi:hypothetical protein